MNTDSSSRSDSSAKQNHQQQQQIQSSSSSGVYLYDSNQPEDNLNSETVRHGYQYVLPRSINEHGSLWSKSGLCTIRAEYIQMLLSFGNHKNENVHIYDFHKLKRGALKDAFFIAAISKDKAFEWFQRWSSDFDQVIINGQICLKVPIFLQKEDVFKHLFECLVPIQKALLYIKLHAAHSCSSDPRFKRRSDPAAELAIEWTSALCEAMGRVFDVISAASSGCGIDPFHRPLDFYDYVSDLLVVMCAENLADHQTVLDWICERTVRHIGSLLTFSVQICLRIISLCLRLSSHVLRSEYATRLVTFYSCSAINVLKTNVVDCNQSMSSREHQCQLDQLYELFACFVHKVILDYPDALVLVSLPFDACRQVDQSLVKSAIDQLATKTSSTLIDPACWSSSSPNDCSFESDFLKARMLENEAKIRKRNHLLSDEWSSDKVLEQALNNPYRNIYCLIDYLNRICGRQTVLNTAAAAAPFSLNQSTNCTSIAVEHKFAKKLLSVIKHFIINEQTIENDFAKSTSKCVSIVCQWALTTNHRSECHAQDSLKRIYLCKFVLTQLLSNVRSWNPKNEQQHQDEEGSRAKAGQMVFESLLSFLTTNPSKILGQVNVLQKTCLLFSMLVEDGTVNYGAALHKLRFTDRLRLTPESDPLKSGELSALLANIPIVSKAPNSELQRGRRIGVLYGFDSQTTSDRAKLIDRLNRSFNLVFEQPEQRTAFVETFRDQLCIHEQYIVCEKLCDRLRRCLLDPSEISPKLCLRFELTFEMMKICGCVRPVYFELLAMTFDTILRFLNISIGESELRLFGDAISIARKYSDVLVQQFRSLTHRLFDSLMASCNLLLSKRNTLEILHVPYTTIIVSARVLYRRLFSRLRSCSCNAESRSACPHIFKSSCPMYNVCDPTSSTSAPTGQTTTTPSLSSSSSSSLSAGPAALTNIVTSSNSSVPKASSWVKLDDDEVARRLLIHLHKSSSLNDKSSIKLIADLLQLLQRSEPTVASHILNSYAQKVHCSQHLSVCWTRVISSALRAISSNQELDEETFTNVIQLITSRGVVTLPNLITMLIATVNHSSIHLVRNVGEALGAVGTCCLLLKKVLGGSSKLNFDDPFGFMDSYCLEDAVNDKETAIVDLLIILAKHLLAFDTQMSLAITNMDGVITRKRKFQRSRCAFETAEYICRVVGHTTRKDLMDTNVGSISKHELMGDLYNLVNSLRRSVVDKVLCEKNSSRFAFWLLFAKDGEGIDDALDSCDLWNIKHLITYLVFCSSPPLVPDQNFENLCSAIVRHISNSDAGGGGTDGKLPGRIEVVCMVAQQFISMFPDFAREFFAQSRTALLNAAGISGLQRQPQQNDIWDFPLITLMFSCVDAFDKSTESVLQFIRDFLGVFLKSDGFDSPTPPQHSSITRIIRLNLNLFWCFVKNLENDSDSLMDWIVFLSKLLSVGDQWYDVFDDCSESDLEDMLFDMNRSLIYRLCYMDDSKYQLVSKRISQELALNSSKRYIDLLKRLLPLPKPQAEVMLSATTTTTTSAPTHQTDLRSMSPPNSRALRFVQSKAISPWNLFPGIRNASSTYLSWFAAFLQPRRNLRYDHKRLCLHDHNGSVASLTAEVYVDAITVPAEIYEDCVQCGSVPHGIMASPCGGSGDISSVSSNRSGASPRRMGRKRRQNQQRLTPNTGTSPLPLPPNHPAPPSTSSATTPYAVQGTPSDQGTPQLVSNYRPPTTPNTPRWPGKLQEPIIPSAVQVQRHHTQQQQQQYLNSAPQAIGYAFSQTVDGSNKRNYEQMVNGDWMVNMPQQRPPCSRIRLQNVPVMSAVQQRPQQQQMPSMAAYIGGQQQQQQSQPVLPHSCVPMGFRGAPAAAPSAAPPNQFCANVYQQQQQQQPSFDEQRYPSAIRRMRPMHPQAESYSLRPYSMQTYAAAAQQPPVASKPTIAAADIQHGGYHHPQPTAIIINNQTSTSNNNPYGRNHAQQPTQPPVMMPLTHQAQRMPSTNHINPIQQQRIIDQEIALNDQQSTNHPANSKIDDPQQPKQRSNTQPPPYPPII